MKTVLTHFQANKGPDRLVEKTRFLARELLFIKHTLCGNLRELHRPSNELSCHVTPVIDTWYKTSHANWSVFIENRKPTVHTTVSSAGFYRKPKTAKFIPRFLFSETERTHFGFSCGNCRNDKPRFLPRFFPLVCRGPYKQALAAMEMFLCAVRLQK